METQKQYRLVVLNDIAVDVELAKIRKTQAWLASRIGVSRQLFNQHYRKRSLKYADQIAAILNVSKSDIMCLPEGV